MLGIDIRSQGTKLFRLHSFATSMVASSLYDSMLPSWPSCHKHAGLADWRGSDHQALTHMFGPNGGLGNKWMSDWTLHRISATLSRPSQRFNRHNHSTNIIGKNIDWRNLESRNQIESSFRNVARFGTECCKCFDIHSWQWTKLFACSMYCGPQRILQTTITAFVQICY